MSDDVVDGIKLLDIQAEMRYPIVSAYEFEFLKKEEEVRNRLKGASIYLIVQREAMFFEKLVTNGNILEFDISDSTNLPIHCKLDLIKAGMTDVGDIINLELQYHKAIPSEEPPYNCVAAFKLTKEDGSFIVWETPSKFLYEVLANGLPASINGDIGPYIHYKVHYIGKAWAQDVWDRLTGHDNLQEILTLEGPISTEIRMPSYEVAILIIDIVGYDEANMIGGYEFAIPAGVKPIIHYLKNEQDFEKFFDKPPIEARAVELTNETEAMLVRIFMPKYNDVKFENYPRIKRGARSAGFTSSSLTLSRMPVRLSTLHRPYNPFGTMDFDASDLK